LVYDIIKSVTYDRWFSRGTLVSSTNKTDRQDITEILLKVALNTINLNQVYDTINPVYTKPSFTGWFNTTFNKYCSCCLYYAQCTI